MNQVSTAPLGDLAVRELSTSLSGCRITVCAGGGIAATELPRVARELRRHGAAVNFVVTETALKFIGSAALEWASGAPVVVNPTGLSEHIFDGDALLVAPATADVLAKAAHGLCTDGVTTLLQSAFGQGKPVFFLPTMHDSMAHSPFVLKNVHSLSALHHVYFLEPRREEGKLKAPDPKRIALEISHRWNAARQFDGRAPRVALTYGGTRAAIDPVRCITNLSTGRLGVQLAEADVDIGDSRQRRHPPPGVVADLHPKRASGDGEGDDDLHVAAGADVDAVDHAEFHDVCAEFGVHHTAEGVAYDIGGRRRRAAPLHGGNGGLGGHGRILPVWPVQSRPTLGTLGPCSGWSS